MAARVVTWTVLAALAVQAHAQDGGLGVRVPQINLPSIMTDRIETKLPRFPKRALPDLDLPLPPPPVGFPRFPNRIPPELDGPLPEPSFDLPQLPRTSYDPYRACHQALHEDDAPGLPDKALTDVVGDVAATIAQAQPDDFPVLEQTAAGAKEERSARRDRLAALAERAGAQLAALTRLDAQIVRLDDVQEAARSLGLLRDAHQRRAERGDLPNAFEYALNRSNPPECQIWYPTSEASRQFYFLEIADLAYGEFTSRIVLTVTNGKIAEQVGAALSGGCGGESGLEFRRGCGYRYYFNDNQTCAVRGLVEGPTPGQFTLGCTMYKRIYPPKPTVADIDAFHSAVGLVGSNAAAADSRFREVRAASARRVRLPAQALQAALLIEAADLAVWHQNLEKLATEIAQLRTDVYARQAELNEIVSNKAAQSTALEAASADLQRLEAQISQGEADLDRLDSDIDQAKHVLDGVELNCGGVSYRACADQQAKQDFDRAQYEAQQALLQLRQQRATRRTEVQSYRSDRRDASARVNAATAALIKAGAGETRVRLVLARQTREFDDATRKYDAELPVNVAYSAANESERVKVDKLLAVAAAGTLTAAAGQAETVKR